MLNEPELLRRAFSAYFRATQDGLHVQPSDVSGVQTVADKSYVVLRNVNGILSVYRVRNDGMLKRLKRWPKSLE